MIYKYFFTLTFAFNVCFVSSQSYIDIFTFRKTRHETYDFQVEKLKRWKIKPQIITVFNKVYIDSICSISYSLDTIMCKDKSFSPIQFRVYKGNVLYTGWQYCFGNLSKFGILSKDTIMDIKRLPINRALHLENDIKMIQPSEEQKKEMKNSINYDYVIIAFWDPYLGRGARKMLQRIQRFMDDSGSKNVFFITVNYNGTLEKIAK